MGILFDDRGEQGVSRMEAPCTNHRIQPIRKGQKVNVAGNALVFRAASEHFLIWIATLLHQRGDLGPFLISTYHRLSIVNTRPALDHVSVLAPIRPVSP
jgi:hypothetical protein